jgi:membrane protease YdiL (CAAX protease family)
MSAPNSATRQPAPYSPLRGLVARHPAVAFLVLAFWFGWTSLIPILLSENGFGVLPIELPLTVVQTLATVLGLALPAFLVTAATRGKKGVRDLLGRLLRWRVGLHWYLFVLFGLPVSVLLSAIVLHGTAPLGALARNWGLLFTVFLPGVVVPFLHTNLWEELGWTGFLQSTLQERRGPLLASLIVVPFFALFHLPARFVAGWIVDEHTARPGPHRFTGVLCRGSGRRRVLAGPHHVGLQRFRAQRDRRWALPQRLQHDDREGGNARTSEPPSVRDLLDVLGGARGACSGCRRVHQGSSRLRGATGRDGGSSGSTEGSLTTI